MVERLEVSTAQARAILWAFYAEHREWLHALHVGQISRQAYEAWRQSWEAMRASLWTVVNG